MPMIVVPLKVALGLEKLDFWAFKKSKHEESLGYTWCDYVFEMPKNKKNSNPNATFNGNTVTGISKAAQNN